MKKSLVVNWQILKNKDDFDSLINKILFEKYDELEIFSCFMTNGFEFKKMKKFLKKYKNQFKKITFSKPILQGSKNLKKFADFLIDEYQLQKNKNYILVGHGTEKSKNRSYFKLKKILQKKGFLKVEIGMLKGKGSLTKNYLLKLQKKYGDNKKFFVIPLFLENKNHLKNDVFGISENSFVSILKKNGFSTENFEKSLCENQKFVEEFLKA